MAKKCPKVLRFFFKILPLVMMIAVVLCGCDTPGGHVDHSDPNAPKEILSKEIVSLSTAFYRDSPDTPDDNGLFSYSLEKDSSGKVVLSEKQAYHLTEEIDPRVLEQAQRIIDDCDLVSLNGTENYVSGLPAEFQPYYLSVQYASGESLYFYVTGDPCAEWTRDFQKLFRQSFVEAGHPELNTDENQAALTRFSLECNADNLSYSYIPFIQIMPNGTEKIVLYRSIVDLDTDRQISKRSVDLPDDYLPYVQTLIDDLYLAEFDNGQIIPPKYRKTADGFCHFYAEYEDGRVLTAFFDDPQTLDDFSFVRDQLIRELDAYFLDGTETIHSEPADPSQLYRSWEFGGEGIPFAYSLVIEESSSFVLHLSGDSELVPNSVFNDLEGTAEIDGNRIRFLSGPFTSEYAYETDGDFLRLFWKSGEHIFPAAEEADYDLEFYRCYDSSEMIILPPDRAAAAAFAVVDVQDIKEGYEKYYWQLISAMMTLGGNQDSYTEGGFCMLSEEELMQLTHVLFGSLPNCPKKGSDLPDSPDDEYGAYSYNGNYFIPDYYPIYDMKLSVDEYEEFTYVIYVKSEERVPPEFWGADFSYGDSGDEFDCVLKEVFFMTYVN